MTHPSSSTLNNPFLAEDAEETSALGSLKQRVAKAWLRHRFKRIQQAIKSYDPEKHFLSPVFRPVVGPATMRMANREIERNKLPFNPESGRPWLANAHAKSPLQLASNAESQAESELSALPASLRGLRRDSSSLTPESADESPIILIT